MKKYRYKKEKRGGGGRGKEQIRRILSAEGKELGKQTSQYHRQ